MTSWTLCGVGRVKARAQVNESMAEPSLGDIMRKNWYDLTQACKERGLDSSGQRWELAVRLAVACHPTIIQTQAVVPQPASSPRTVMCEAGVQTENMVGEKGCQTEDVKDDAEGFDPSDLSPMKENVSSPDHGSPSSSPSLPSRYQLRKGLAQEEQSALNTSEGQDPCEVCGAEACVCPTKVKTMAALTYYELPGRPRQRWLRFKTVGNKHVAGCQVCIDFQAKGNSLHGRQALGRYELDLSNPNNHGKVARLKFSDVSADTHACTIMYYDA